MMPLPVRQVAYFTTDIRAAASNHRAVFGSGPFVVAEHIPTPIAHYRGRPMPLDHSSAYGQWGPVMVEFVQQHNPDPSAFHDLFPHGSGRAGLHHLAVFVDDLERSLAEFADRGMETALHAVTSGGVAFAMVDASATLGHMIELYEPSPVLTGFYGRIAAAADPDPAKPVFLEP